MDDDRPLFILAGNGPYENRGCEAIARGTVKILREYYKKPRFLSISFFHDSDQFVRQSENETDTSILHKKTVLTEKKFDREWWRYVVLHILRPDRKKYRMFKEMLPYLNNAEAVLSLGGDNYSLDYGIPNLFVDLDDIVIQKKRPIIIWGASVGPFVRIPEYEKFMIDHLRKVTAIFARESETIDYLKKLTITKNVYPVADPAFLLDPTEPDFINVKLKIEDGAIGLNFSPLMANYVTHGNISDWEKLTSKIISELSESTQRTIYLIPHVTRPNDDDYLFLKRALAGISHKKQEIVLIPPIYNASQTKWIISKMTLFAGSRTHSTIASLSSGVPTLCFAYSSKAIGINRDIFGHEEYCIGPEKCSPEIIVERVRTILQNSGQINDELRMKIPDIKNKALNAGKLMKEIIEINTHA